MPKEKCNQLRTQIQSIGDEVKRLMDDETFDGDQVFVGQHGEMKANIMLSFRHLEDARMRLGKVIQQIDGGTSIYDKG